MHPLRGVMLVAGLCACPWTARAWNAPLRLSPADAVRDQISVDVAVAPDGTAYVAWQRFDPGSPFDSDVMLSCSSDGGATFSTPVRAEQAAGDAEAPRISAGVDPVSGNVRLDLVFFVLEADQGFLRFEMPAGNPCAIPADAPPDIDASGLLHVSDLDTDLAGNVYVGRIDHSAFMGNDEVRVAVVGSASSVVSNLSPALLDASAPTASSLSVSARGATRPNAQVALVWQKSLINERIGIAWSLDGGATWVTSELIEGAANLINPSIAWSGPGSDAVVVYTRVGTPNEAVARRVHLDTGVTTLGTTTVSGAGTSPTGPLHVAARGGLPTLATWERNTGSAVNVYAVTSSNLGMTWSTPPTLVFSNPGTTAAVPRAAVGSAWIAWTRDQESNGKTDVWLSVDSTIGTTATRLDGLEAAWRSGDVETAWRLTPQSGVLSMQVLSVNGTEIGAPVTADPLVDRYAVLDQTPGDDPAYLVRLELGGGGTEVHGPVRPGGRTLLSHAGCGTAGPGTSPYALLLPAAAFVALALRRSRDAGRRS